MTSSLMFKADFTTPVNGSAFGSFVYEIQGLENPAAFFKLIPVKPGLYMTIYSQADHHPAEMAFEIQNAPVVFSYMLSGSCTHQVRGFKGRRQTEFNLMPMTNTIGSFPRVEGNMAFDDRNPVICVDLKIDRRLLLTYLCDRIDSLPRGLRPLTVPDAQFYFASPLERGMLATANEIIRPPDFTGTTLDLFYESRALDLLSRQLEALTHPGTRFSSNGIARGDLERIRHARKLLVSDLKNPPTIAALSRLCGINEFKLKKGFKQVFNTTIFSHLQQVKMERAWHLIEQGERSVTEAASEVGYTNISHFSAAFRRQFAINPGALKKASTLTRVPLPREPEQTGACRM